MLKAVVNYQKASEEILNILRKNKKVLAAFVYGSIVSGDLWEGSDIDIFVVYDDSFENVRDVYSEVLSIPVHMKILEKEKFLENYKNNDRKGTIRKLLLSSKLIFSRDDEIDNIFDAAKYSNDSNNEMWNLVYLGDLIKTIGITKKYIYNDNVFTAYEVLIRTLDSFAKLYLNMNSYIVSKDAVKMVMNLDNKFNGIVEDLYKNECSYKYIKNTVDFIEEYIERNISEASKVLIDYLYEKNAFLSSYEIKNNAYFKEFNIRVEYILKELVRYNIVIKDVKKLDLTNGEELISENVYSYKGYK